MRAVRRTDTRPELILRAALREEGLGYRVGVRVAGARPDVCFLRAKVAVFVDGCFWHGCPTHYVPPVANATFWTEKLRRVVTRDARDTLRMQVAGFEVLRFWECQVAEDPRAVAAAVRDAVHARRPFHGRAPSEKTR